MPATSLTVVRCFAVIALGLSLYLVGTSARHAGPIGCDPMSGCGQVLGGRWSFWFGIPVSFVGAAVYLIIVLSSVRTDRSDRLWYRSGAGRVMLIGTALAAGAGIWFIAIQVTMLGAVCKYCLAIHACGIASAFVAWSAARSETRRLLRPVGIGLLILIAGQMLPAPRPYESHAGAVAMSPSRATVSIPTAREAIADVDRHVRFAAGGRLFDLDPGVLPSLGSPNARHFIVVMSDYTCEHCRVTHRMLERALRSAGDDPGVIVLPTLLDPACNPYLPPGVTRPLPQDCALTRLALAVFCAKPQAFAEMNRWLFAEDRVRGEAEARAYATELVGADALRAGEADPRVREIILLGCELFARTGSGAIPKMLIGSTAISGPVSDSEALREPMRREWGGLTPSGGETRTRE